MAATVIGRFAWSGGRNEEGHREYMIKHRVRAAITDGPLTVLSAAGLPVTGSVWAFGGEIDAWAFCTPMARAMPYKATDGEPHKEWITEHKFSTKPIQSKRCQDETIDDPLLEPQKISGSFVKYTKEITKDKDGNAVKSSSHEPFRGAQVEFDDNRPTVEIGQNVAILDLDVFSQMVDTVNDAPLWGLSARCVKLSNVSWERQLYGTCTYYFTRTFEFDIDYDTFDRVIYDEGYKVLDTDIAGADKTNPSHFKRYVDQKGNPAGPILLDGNGAALTVGASPIELTVQYYSESNFLLLGIPTNFGST